MNEHIGVTADLVLNQSKFDAQLKQVPEKIKQAVTKGGSSVSSFMQGKTSSIGTHTSSFVKKNEDRFSQMRKDFNSGSSVSDNITTKGSIYQMAKGDMDAVSNLYGIAKTNFAKMRGKNLSANNSNNSSSDSSGSGLSNGGFSSNNNTKNIQSAVFNVAHGNFNQGGSGSGSGQFGGGVHIPGRGSSPSVPSSVGSPSSSKGVEGGGGMSRVGGALGMAGGFMLASAGFLLKLVSDVAESAKESYSKQSGTRGATGNTVRGGGDLFADAEVAQANVALGKADGREIFKKGNQITKDVMQFSRGNNESLSAMVSELAGIKKNTDPNGKSTLSTTLASVRGMANSAGFTGLREPEYLKRISSFASARAEGQGAFLNTKDYGEFTGGLNASEMTATRRQNLSEKLQNSSFSGPFSGDAIGQMAFAKAMEANGGDISQAMLDLEKNSGKYASQSTSFLKDQMGGTAFGLMYKQSGIGSFTEGSSLNSSMKGFEANNKMTQAGSDVVIGNTNDLDATYETEAGMRLVGWQHRYQKNKANIAMGVGEGTLDALDTAENGVLELGKASAQTALQIVDAGKFIYEAMSKFFGADPNKFGMDGKNFKGQYKSQVKKNK